MASELGFSTAKKLSGMVSAPYHEWWANIIDTELAEVREVLDGLRTVNGCWCSPMASASLSPLHHSESCQRTSALYQKLRTDK